MTAAADDDLIDVAAGAYVENVTIPAERRLTVQGAGAGLTVVDGGGIDATLRVQARAEVAVSGLTLTNGVQGIDSIAATVQISDVEISASIASGVRVFPEHLRRAGGRVTIANSSISGSGGEGIDAYQATITIDGSTIEQNADGGMFLNTSTGTVESSRFVDNGSGGIGVFEGRLKVFRSTIGQNAGSGLQLSSRSRTYLTETTIAGNSGAGQGGGLFAYKAFLQLTNCTVSGNQAGDSGAMYVQQSRIVLRNTTVAGNSAVTGVGGIFVNPFRPGSITAFNSVLADNTGGVAGECSGRFRSGGYNLIEDATGCDIRGASTNLTGVDPLLGPLADNGGPTETHALLAGSPAIDAGNPVPARCPSSDQRGVARTGRCDIGAYEAP